MRPYLAHIKINLKLTLRDKMVLFFNYIFPLLFFFIFAQVYGGRTGGAAFTQVVSMVLIIGVLGNGFFGAGIRAIQERELNILRRFKVAPIGPGPILAASMFTGWTNYLPMAVLVLTLAKVVYHMPVPANWFSLLVFLSIGIVAFRAIGMTIASVVNSAQEGQIIIQLFYFPMLFLSGATIPLEIMPKWVQTIAQFLPASHLFLGIQGIMVRQESLAETWRGALALMITTAVAVLLSVKLFRWEKEEHISGTAKLWLAAVMVPFLALGAWELHSEQNLKKVKTLSRDMRRNRSLLVHGVRVFTGEGVIDSGAVLMRNGKIERVWTGKSPKGKDLNADSVEAVGKTILPALIDAHVHLGSPGGFWEKAADYQKDAMPRELAAYLYCGVAAVRSAGDPLDAVRNAQRLTASAERLGAELFLVGPLFTAPGGHGTEYAKFIPEAQRALFLRQFVRTPKTAAEARTQVRELAAQGVDAIKAVLDAGSAGMLFERMDPAVLRAVVEATHQSKLKVVVHTGDARDVAEAVAAGADGIEHGSSRERIPDDVLKQMAARGVTYDATLSVVEAFQEFGARKATLLDRTMVLQVAPDGLIDATRKVLGKGAPFPTAAFRMDIAADNLARAHRAGVPLLAGTDSGNPLLVHGPAMHRELQLWVQAGVPAADAIRAATLGNAKALGIDKRMGRIVAGYDATLILVDGNPFADIGVTERLTSVYFKGERVDRSSLFDQN